LAARGTIREAIDKWQQKQSQRASKEALMKNGINHRRKRGLHVVLPKRSSDQALISRNELWLIETALAVAGEAINAARKTMTRVMESVSANNH
jgi:hypothetical protein